MARPRRAAAATLRWLTEELGLRRVSERSTVTEAWERHVAVRHGEAPFLVFLADWPHDFWVAHGSATAHGDKLSSVWRHDGDIDSWPAFRSAKLLEAVGAGSVQRTRGAELRALAESVPPAPEGTAAAALGQF